MKRRELLAAGIVRDFRFRNQNELDIYLYDLKKKYMEYQVLETVTKPDGTILARINQRYNDCPLIQLYED